MDRPGPPNPKLIKLGSEHALATELGRAGLVGYAGVLVVAGGAAGLTGGAEDVARQVIEGVVVPVAVDQQLVIVDGGTDSGVMRIVGRAHGGRPDRPPLVGVAVRRLIRTPGPADISPDAEDVEPHHTHLVLVPGQRWGDEVGWTSAVARTLSPAGRAVTVVLNGGAITLAEVQSSVAARRPVVAVAGSGRLADLLAADFTIAGDRPRQIDSFDVRAAVADGLLAIIDPASQIESQRAKITRLLDLRVPPTRR